MQSSPHWPVEVSTAQLKQCYRQASPYYSMQMFLLIQPIVGNIEGVKSNDEKKQGKWYNVCLFKMYLGHVCFNQYLSDFDNPVYLAVAHFRQTGADPFVEIHLVCLRTIQQQTVIKIMPKHYHLIYILYSHAITFTTGSSS